MRSSRTHGVGQNVGRNEPCWCGSGRKYKFCCLPNFKLWLFDHPGCSDVWDTQAYSREHATRAFKAEWESRLAQEALHPDLKFEDGKIRREDQA